MLTLVGSAACGPAPDDDVRVVGHAKISALHGGFRGELTDDAIFGRAVEALGDLDGDGVPEVAVGAPGFRQDEGVLWLLSLAADGTVSRQVRIGGDSLGDDPPSARSAFGGALARLGDLDGDGVTDLLVGAARDRQDGLETGSVRVLMLDGSGGVRRSTKIAPGAGGFTGHVDVGDFFGVSVAALGDLDGDGVADAAVGARRNGGGESGDAAAGENTGAVWLLFLTRDGGVRAHRKIGATSGDLAGALAGGDEFGQSVASLGDLDGDGVPDLAVGAFRDDDGGTNRGAVWLLFLQRDGQVKSFTKISQTSGGFGGALNDNGLFGSGLALLGDLDCDGLPELGVGQRRSNDGGPDTGAVWILSLRRDGRVARHARIGRSADGLAGALAPAGEFGYVLTTPGDLDGDGSTDLVVGQIFDDDGGSNRGSVWILFLRTREPDCRAG